MTELEKALRLRPEEVSITFMPSKLPGKAVTLILSLERAREIAKELFEDPDIEGGESYFLIQEHETSDQSEKEG